MPSEYFAAVEQSKGTLILAIVFIGLCLFFVYLYFRVQRPKRGTIEWISFYEKKQFTPFTYAPLDRSDILPAVFTGVLAMTICSIRFVLHYKMGFMPELGKPSGELILSGAGMALLLCSAFYIFFRIFFSSRSTACLVTGLSCALYSNELFAVNILLILSWLFLYLWICCNNRDYKWYYPLYLLLSGVLFCITLTICWPTFYLAPIYISGFIIGKTVQRHPGDAVKKKGGFFLSMLLAMIAGFIGVLSMWMVYYAYRSENMNLLQTALSGEAFQSFFPAFIENFINLAVPETSGVAVVRQDVFRPILFITSLIPTVYSGFFKRKSHAVAAVFCAIWFLCIWIMKGIDLMCPGSMLSIGWMFKGFRDRGYRHYSVYITFTVIIFYFASLAIDFILK